MLQKILMKFWTREQKSFYSLTHRKLIYFYGLTKNLKIPIRGHKWSYKRKNLSGIDTDTQSLPQLKILFSLQARTYLSPSNLFTPQNFQVRLTQLIFQNVFTLLKRAYVFNSNHSLSNYASPNVVFQLFSECQGTNYTMYSSFPNFSTVSKLNQLVSLQLIKIFTVRQDLDVSACA